jgi:hypothetical protein
MGRRAYKGPKGGYEMGGERHVDELNRWNDDKWRSNWAVDYCSRSVPYGDRGACVNFGDGCGSCFRFSNFKEAE